MTTPAAAPARRMDGNALLILVVAALAMTATLPGRTFGLGLVTKWLLLDLSLSQVEWAQVNLWATLIGSLFCFPAGRLLDRYGSRVVLFVTLAALGGVTWSLAHVHGFAALTVLVTLTRGFGQSALSVVSIYLIGKSFDRRLAWPMATYSVLMTIGFVVAFQTIGAFLPTEDQSGQPITPDWRSVWSGVGIVLLVAAPLSWLALSSRRRAALVDQVDAESEAADSSFTLGDALRSPVFWIFAVATSLFGLVTSGLTLFNLFVLEARGFGMKDFLAMQALSVPAGLLGQGACGWLARQYSYQRITGVALLLYALGLFELTRLSSFGELVGCGLLMGVSGGTITVVFFAVWSRLFGRRHLGRIQGVAQMGTVVASAVGPLLFALSHDRLGSYVPALYGLGAATAAFGVACWLAPMPRRTSGA